MEETDKIENSIALCQATIEALEKIKERVKTSEAEEIRIKIETKHWYGYSEPHLAKEKHKIETTKHSAIVLLDTAIELQREKINKLIDMEIEKRKNTKVEDKE